MIIKIHIHYFTFSKEFPLGAFSTGRLDVGPPGPRRAGPARSRAPLVTGTPGPTAISRRRARPTNPGPAAARRAGRPGRLQASLELPGAALRREAVRQTTPHSPRRRPRAASSASEPPSCRRCARARSATPTDRAAREMARAEATSRPGPFDGAASLSMSHSRRKTAASFSSRSRTVAPVRSGAFSSSCCAFHASRSFCSAASAVMLGGDGRLEFRDALAQPGRVLHTFVCTQFTGVALRFDGSFRSPQLVELPEVRLLIRRVRRPAAPQPLPAARPSRMSETSSAASRRLSDSSFACMASLVDRSSSCLARHRPSSAACCASACFFGARSPARWPRRARRSGPATQSRLRASASHRCTSSRGAFLESLAFSTTWTLDFRSWQARFHRSASTWQPQHRASTKF